MIKASCFLIAEYAGVTADSRLTVAGTFDSLDVQRVAGMPPDALSKIPFPRAYLAVVTEASIADGLSHQMRLRIVNGNGQQIMDETPIAVAYSLNRFGRPMRNNMVISLGGLILPGPDDYIFELHVDGQSGAFAELTFYVNDVSGPHDG